MTVCLWAVTIIVTEGDQLPVRVPVTVGVKVALIVHWLPAATPPRQLSVSGEVPAFRNAGESQRAEYHERLSPAVDRAGSLGPWTLCRRGTVNSGKGSEVAVEAAVLLNDEDDVLNGSDVSGVRPGPAPDGRRGNQNGDQTECAQRHSQQNRVRRFPFLGPQRIPFL